MSNTLYPGLPDYTGPTEGQFTFLHHEGPIVEQSHNVMERVAYIGSEKAKNETSEQIETRLRHIVYVAPDSPIAEAWKTYGTACAEAWKTYDAAREEARKTYDAAREEAYVSSGLEAALREVIPDLGWDGRTIFGGKK